MVNATMPDISFITAIATLMPEVMLSGAIVILLLGGVFIGSKGAVKIHGLAVFVLMSLLVLMFYPPMLHLKREFFFGLFITDDFSYYVKTLLIAGALLSFMLAGGWLGREENRQPEFPVLMLLALLGMMLMVSANDLMALYLGLELSSLPLYVLAAISRDSTKATEAGLKYFVLSALASGILLFGASLVYGFAGSTSFTALGHLLKAGAAIDPAVLVGLVLIIVSLCFKISAVPFHMWTPDVYEGAPTPVTAYFSIAPKIAAIALFARVLSGPFGGMMGQWQQVIVVVSAISMVVGALGALTQSNIKRLLAYSSIGHVGYGLVGLAAGGIDGISSVLIYFTLYVPMSAGAFACVLMMQRGGEPAEQLSDLAGLSRTRPRMAFALAVFMFSMAGIPPLAGFFGKLYVFLAALHSGLTVLAVIGVLASVLACFYYLKVVKIMYFDEPAAAFDTKMPAALRWALAVCTLITLCFFLMPAPLVTGARTAAEALFQ